MKILKNKKSPNQICWLTTQEGWKQQKKKNKASPVASAAPVKRRNQSEALSTPSSYLQDKCHSFLGLEDSINGNKIEPVAT